MQKESIVLENDFEIMCLDYTELNNMQIVSYPPPPNWDKNIYLLSFWTPPFMKLGHMGHNGEKIGFTKAFIR